MRIYCIRHVYFEGPGVIENWAADCQHDFRIIKPYEGEAFPDVGEMDALIIMGGPMGVNDIDKYPWLTIERKLIKDVLDRHLPLLGICLGAQLLASVLGSKVYKNKYKEIGWFGVNLTNDGEKHRLTRHLPRSFTTFHWHGDTFDLPIGAEHLASSDACQQQAFAYQNALGLQFHMEMTEDGVAEVSERCASEFVSAPFIQPREQLMEHPAIIENHSNLNTILNEWISYEVEKSVVDS